MSESLHSRAHCQSLPYADISPRGPRPLACKASKIRSTSASARKFGVARSSSFVVRRSPFVRRLLPSFAVVCRCSSSFAVVRRRSPACHHSSSSFVAVEVIEAVNRHYSSLFAGAMLVVAVRRRHCPRLLACWSVVRVGSSVVGLFVRCRSLRAFACPSLCRFVCPVGSLVRWLASMLWHLVVLVVVVVVVVVAMMPACTCMSCQFGIYAVLCTRGG